MDNQYLNMLKKRRSIYSIGKNINISNEGITNLVKSMVRESPSPMNSQSSRAVILFNSNHNKLWDIVLSTLKKVTPEDRFQATSDKIASFKGAYGTILFFEDMNVVEELKKKFPLYKDTFPSWSDQSSGMAQHSVWTAFANISIGASLQHYNPIIDDEVKSTWNIPSSWKLQSQMPFGSIESPPGEKEYVDDNTRFLFFE